MTAETKLNRILLLTDSNIKLSKLFVFSCKVLPHCQLWDIANKEQQRLLSLGLRYSKIRENKIKEDKIK